MSDLDRLIEAAEAGNDADFRRANRAVFSTPAQDVELQLREENCRYAYRGSLDAAKALHEALLPGWGWRKQSARSLDIEVVSKSFSIGPDDDCAGFEAHKGKGSTPARSWLLAILRAYLDSNQAEGVR